MTVGAEIRVHSQYIVSHSDDDNSQPARKKPRKQVNQSSDEEEEEGEGAVSECGLHVQTMNV